MKLKNYKNLTRTKLIATAGPTFGSYEDMKSIIEQGVNVVRLNTSHGDYEEHLGRIENVKKIRKELDLPISLLLDTKGPEIRTGDFSTDKVQINKNSKVVVTTEEVVGNETLIPVSYKDLPETVVEGQNILIDDGKLLLKVTKVNEKDVETTALNTHIIKKYRGVNIPGAILKLPFISEHDRNYIIWGIKQGIDYVAASFVSSVEDIRELRKLLDDNGGEDVQIMPKIESLTSLHNLNKIFKESDAVMLARGDLGVEIPFDEVPFYEQLIVNKARAFAIPVVVATQMLESMTDSPVPTRAEVTDVNYAVKIATDSTMLSGETSASEFPIEAVKVMQRIKSTAEIHFNYRRAYMEAYAYVSTTNAETSYEIAHRSLNNDIVAIFTFTEKGRLVRALSSFRVKAPIIAMVPTERMWTQFGANYNVFAKVANYDDFSDDGKIQEYAKEMGFEGKVIVAHASDWRIVEVN